MSFKINFKILYTVWCIMYVPCTINISLLWEPHRYLQTMKLSIAGMIQWTPGKSAKDPGVFQHLKNSTGVCAPFLQQTVLKGFVRAKQLHTAGQFQLCFRPKTAPEIQSWKRERGTTGLLFIELPGSGMTGIRPKLRSALQRCPGLCTKLLSVFKHDSASNGVVVSHL